MKMLSYVLLADKNDQESASLAAMANGMSMSVATSTSSPTSCGQQNYCVNLGAGPLWCSWCSYKQDNCIITVVSVCAGGRGPWPGQQEASVQCGAGWQGADSAIGTRTNSRHLSILKLDEQCERFSRAADQQECGRGRDTVVGAAVAWWSVLECAEWNCDWAFEGGFCDLARIRWRRTLLQEHHRLLRQVATRTKHAHANVHVLGLRGLAAEPSSRTDGCSRRHALYGLFDLDP